MKLFVTFLLLSGITKISSAPTLSLDDDAILDNMAWLYAEYALSYDPALSDVVDIFKSEFDDKGKSIENNYFSSCEIFENFFSYEIHRVFPEMNYADLMERFNDKVKAHKRNIIETNKVPVRPAVVFQMFKAFTDATDEASNFLTAENVRERFGNRFFYIKDNFKVKLLECIDINDSELVKTSLENINFETLYPDQYKSRLENKESRSYTLFDDIKEELKGIDDGIPKPRQWTVHHMIPSSTILDFYRTYFKLMSQKSDEYLVNGKFDWPKIIELNMYRSSLLSAKKVWTMSSKIPTLPVYGNEKGRFQLSFVSAWYRWPAGLLFYGPASKLRKDDPDSGFEETVKHVVGTKYAKIVEELYDELRDFIKDYDTHKNTNTYEVRAEELYKRMLTVHQHYDGAIDQPSVVIFPYNSKSWENDNGMWKINKGFNADSWVYSTKLKMWMDLGDQSSDVEDIEYFQTKMEWREKYLAQTDDYFLHNIEFQETNFNLLPAAAVVLLNVAKTRDPTDLRKKREASYTNIGEVLSECPKGKEVVSSTNQKPYEPSFWCMKHPWLGLNPTVFLYCKIAGYY
jgi:hypothetical protein